MDIIQYRKMLAEVSKGVRDHELKAMKFICKDFIPKRKQEEIKSALHLWEALEERELLGVHNTRFLRELLQTSGEGRTDLLRVVQCYDGLPVPAQAIPTAPPPGYSAPPGYSSPPVGHPVQETSRLGRTGGLEKEIEFVSGSVGREWRMLGRTLGVREPEIERITEAHGRDLREQSRQCLYAWRDGHPAGAATRDKLIAALRHIQQNYLADELEDLP